MHHERRAVAVEQARRLVPFEGHAEGHELDLRAAAVGDDHVGQIAGMRSRAGFEAVMGMSGVEVPAGGRERRHALSVLVDVEAVLARRQVVQRRRHQHAVGRLGQHGLTDGLSLCAAQRRGDARSARRRDGARESRQHQGDAAEKQADS